MRRPDSLDDVDGILVYADALMTRNDPHGNLIALQHAKKTKQAKSWLQKHATALLGPLAEIEHATKRPSSPPCARCCARRSCHGSRRSRSSSSMTRSRTS